MCIAYLACWKQALAYDFLRVPLQRASEGPDHSRSVRSCLRCLEAIAVYTASSEQGITCTGHKARDSGQDWQQWNRS